MANKTRKRLTKSQLKRDPVAENLIKAWTFFNDHIKAIVAGMIAVIVAIFVIQSVVDSSKSGNRQALALHLMADTYLTQAMSASVSGQEQQAQMALSLLGQTRQIAMMNYQNNPGRIWGVRSAVLAAKCSILMGAEQEAIDLLNEILAAGPSDQLRAEILIHMATAQENRGGQGDLEGAAANCREILEIVPDSSSMAMEAMSLLGSLAMQQNDLEAANDYIGTVTELRGDTTNFQMYQLRRLELMEQGLI